jgi:WD40 repeat protein
MVWHVIRLSIMLVFFIPLQSEVMSELVRTNPQPDWIIYGVDQDGIKTTYLHDVEQYSTTPIPYTHLMDLSTQGELAFAKPSVVPAEVWLVDVQSSANNPKLIFANPRVTRIGSLSSTWSPDGHYLAFMGLEDDNNGRIYVWDGESVIAVDSPQPVSEVEIMVWSQDNRLAFTARPPGENGGDLWPAELYVWDGQQTINISQTPDRNEWTGPWSNDGRLAYSTEGPNQGDPKQKMIWDGVNSAPAFPGFVALEWVHWTPDNELTLSGRLPGDTWLQLYRWDGEQTINISPQLDQGYIEQNWSQDGRWAVGVILRANRWTETIEVRDANNQLLLDVPGIMPPLWTEAGNLLFCQRQPQSVMLQQWDGQQIKPIAQGTLIYVTVPNGGSLVCMYP